MCGIFAIINNPNKRSDSYTTESDIVKTSFEKGANRGPEFSTLKQYDVNILGFHRLAINGLDEISNQPIEIDGCILICNGEIYNYKTLYSLMDDVTPKTNSDCEVIIHLYKKYGIEQTLTMLDGVFAFILITSETIYAARDPYGVRPLYYFSVYQSDMRNKYFFASELKCLSRLADNHNVSIKHFEPGCYMDTKNGLLNKYHIPLFVLNETLSEQEVCKTLFNKLYNAVYKRCVTTERPVACLLSGGLDSSIIASLVSKCVPYQLETYSIGLEGSEDLKYAKKVADHIGSKHTEILVTEQDMINAIDEVIYAIESYDITTIRASLGNYLLGKYIRTHSEAKVIFNGDGSDEVCGGYLYMKACPDDIEYDKETRRLLTEIHKYDVLRSDKCISSHGLEPRTPFLDKSFVSYYVSLPIELRRRPELIEKYLLRKAIDLQDIRYLPDEVLWRRKEAFSDGVSDQGRSLYKIIQENIDNPSNLPLAEAEKMYYKNTFIKFFGDIHRVLDHYWMPKYIESSDPSARTLSIYNK
jgi:asparagine synthase (glutamine-hydrolysing)